MAQTEVIRLLIEDQGRIVWKTFQGKWLEGMADMGLPAEHNDDIFFWRVAQSKNGKLVVCRSIDINGPGELSIYESWDEMRPNLPPRIFENAQKEAGLRRDPVYPEEVLEV